MLRKTVTAAHGEAGGEAAAVAAKNDLGRLVSTTEAAMAAADAALEEAAERDRAAQARARARAKSGIPSFRGCVC